jgi:hypothetical protein
VPCPSEKLTPPDLDGMIRGSCASVPVSSRGQDTWFSATGPGFESPYRYQTSQIKSIIYDTFQQASNPCSSLHPRRDLGALFEDAFRPRHPHVCAPPRLVGVIAAAVVAFHELIGLPTEVARVSRYRDIPTAFFPGHALDHSGAIDSLTLAPREELYAMTNPSRRSMLSRKCAYQPGLAPE